MTAAEVPNEPEPYQWPTDAELDAEAAQLRTDHPLDRRPPPPVPPRRLTIASIEDRAEDAPRGAVAERLEPSRICFDPAFWDGADDAEDWLVEPILARGRGHLLYAPAKAGKSLLALYVAACAAT